MRTARMDEPSLRALWPSEVNGMGGLAAGNKEWTRRMNCVDCQPKMRSLSH